ncbi:maltokinase N-terminal cap-like domain-containing protein [Streptomyces aureoversilis]|uniref:1,4-alpha-glucan branching protein n=1 Tax=Streptomyces aureoversilis TaxID=67277 RepID=A0ABW0A8Y6_9ACTN
MAVIHATTLKPTKGELLTAWLPSRPWYQGAGEPQLTRSGGFRLDDPQGEVGIEFIVVTDTSGTAPVAYLVPLTYRGAPLEGAGDDALVGTMEHGVLGRRWVYDGCHDPVLVAQLLALVEGRVRAQDQNVSDTPDPEVTRSFTGAGPAPADFAVTATTDGAEATELSALHGTKLHLHRVLQPGPDAPASLPEGATGHVGGPWQLPDGTRVRGLFAVLQNLPQA